MSSRGDRPAGTADAPERPSGLTDAEVAQRVAAGQTNDVRVRTGRTLGQIIRANVFTRLNAIVGVLFAIILVIGPIQDGLFAGVIVANMAIGIFQELRAKRTLDRLAIVGEARPRVRRNGTTAELPQDQVVLDDVIELGPGDQVVVDGVVTEATALEIDESLLTGESEPVLKRPGDPVMSGSFVVAGTGSHRTTRVGKEAYAARLAEEASRFTLVRSELRSGVDRILTYISWLLIPIGLLIVTSQLFRADQALPDALRGMVASLVSMVPEGLVLMTSIAFAVGIIRLGRRQCLVQELPAIETLARVDVVCLDKTGTLTEDGMRLAELRLLDGAEAAEVHDVLAALAADESRPNASLRAIAEAYPKDPGWRRTAVAPFSSARKWSGAGFDGHGDWILGAPDVLLTDDGPVAAEAERVAARGLRVLLLARGAHPADSGRALDGLTPVALVVLEQRVRDDARPTLDYFAEQGVGLKVISGDNAASVGAVAGALRLPGSESPTDARDLPADEAGLSERMGAGSVFGRVAPHQKRDMVAALRRRGHTVAMTGDGVNDVLALKDADIGVAMGAGSPAARAVSQIVLLNNRFATLPHVVAEGRRVIANIERVAALFLTKTVYAMTMSTIVGLFGVAYPLLPRHATLINALTIGIPAFIIALAPNTERARAGFVPRVLRLSVPAGVVAGVAAMVSYLIVTNGAGSVDLAARTTPVITLFLVALWVLVLAARPYTWWRVVLIAAMAAGFLGALLIPFGQQFFALDPTDTGNLAVALATAAVAAALISLIRFADRRLWPPAPETAAPAEEPAEAVRA
ncbi:HAD-IC family P-type ATPase [Allonocardiopsis opalescens]|uniref:Cation-transporting ATPase E n=1 Tax=Allonocardiopsis opalescens TaxID=1144618 RepID=A0A2T0QF75_9ACTN|nr:HAD-IC family P-type ATPase [Allonocardiopsis opalescens]PRY02584.1 cation-transporting ATPase E [Allonocardiopsis opalescens]